MNKKIKKVITLFSLIVSPIIFISCVNYDEHKINKPVEPINPHTPVDPIPRVPSGNANIPESEVKKNKALKLNEYKNADQSPLLYESLFFNYFEENVPKSGVIKNLIDFNNFSKNLVKWNESEYLKNLKNVNLDHSLKEKNHIISFLKEQILINNFFDKYNVVFNIREYYHVSIESIIDSILIKENEINFNLVFIDDILFDGYGKPLPLVPDKYIAPYYVLDLIITPKLKDIDFSFKINKIETIKAYEKLREEISFGKYWNKI